MCTLTVAWQTFASHPVVVAANRDERYDRPSVAPHAFDVEGRRVVAPTDEEAGGTWMGYNDAGLFVALTNRWVDLPAGERSRGLLVRDALGCERAEDAARLVERELDVTRYEGFYLLLADANACILVSNDGGTHVTHLDPGVHVVMNVGYDTGYFVPEFRPEPAKRQAENGRRLYESLQPEPGESAVEWRDRAGTALGDHRYGVCIHGEDESGEAAGFGTVSSSLVTIDGDGRREFHFADGPPCETAFERVATDG